MSTSLETTAAAAVEFQNIRRLLSSSSSSNLDENTTKNQWSPFESKADFNLDMSLLLIFIVCFVLIAFILNFCINRFIKRDPPDDYYNTQRLKFQKMAKSSGPTLEFSSETKLAGNDAVCAICLSEFVNGEEIRVLSNCNHGFHVKCIEAWLLSSHTSCPTCRTSCVNTTSTEMKNLANLHVNSADLESGSGNPS